MKQFISVLPQYGDKGMHVEMLQVQLLARGYDPGKPDGDFGNKTRNTLTRLQADNGITATGKADTATLSLLNLEVAPRLSDDPVKAIISIVDQSGISKTSWANRGFAPYGYYYGMALMFARLYQQMKQGDPVAAEMAKPLNVQGHDALFRYDDVFADVGMNNAGSAVNRLRHLFVLMFGLGLMESSGRHCCGWDRGKLNGWGKPSRKIQPTATNSEAGLFQTSFDILDSVSQPVKAMLRGIFETYKNNPDGFAAYFSKGVNCSDADRENYGEGDGKEYQRLSKEVPGFAVAFTAVALRHVTGHWNPVIKIGDLADGLQIKPECDALLQKLQQYVDEKGFDGTAALPQLTEPSQDDKKTAALNLADTLGQRNALQALFDYAPESQANYWAVIDFNKPSSEERLFIFNINDRSVKHYLVAHGENSGDLFATKFSNTNGSHQTSLGIYKTKSVFQSTNHGRALGLKGLQDTNSNAELREIIIHKADYVMADYMGTGRSGRSYGCFAVQPAVINEVIESLRDGSYINAWHS